MRLFVSKNIVRKKKRQLKFKIEVTQMMIR